MRYCTFIFSMSCNIASVMSYLSGIEAKIYRMATSILLKFLTLKWNISRTIWRIEVGEGSFLHFSRSFIWAKLIFRPEVPFKSFIMAMPSPVLINSFNLLLISLLLMTSSVFGLFTERHELPRCGLNYILLKVILFSALMTLLAPRI